jgi:pyruvate, water dikinase
MPADAVSAPACPQADLGGDFKPFDLADPFGRIAAAVTDIGGMMSHAAIVCREYGLPAVTGTGSATTSIRTGQRVRVDGNNGTVTVLDG